MEASQVQRVCDNLEKKGSCKIFLVLLTLVAISMILGAVLLLMWMEIRISIVNNKDEGLVAPSQSYFQRFDSERSFRFARSIGRRRYYIVENGDPMKYDDKFYLSPGEIRRRIEMAIDRERGR